MRCPECGSPYHTQTSLEVICTNCGLVLEDDFLEQPFLSEPQKQSAKLPRNTSAGTGSIQGKIYQSNWFEGYSEKILENYAQRIKQMSERLHLTENVTQFAIELSEDFFRINGFKGRSSEEILASCLYASALMNRQVRTHLEFEHRVGVNRYLILRNYKKIVTELHLEFKRQEVPDLVEMFCSRLKLPPLISFQAVELWNRVKHTPALQSKSAYVIASALIYRVGSVSQREIAFVSGVHEPSMRVILKLL